MTIAGKDGKDAKIYLEKQLKQRLARLEELQGTVTAKCRNGAISRVVLGFRANPTYDCKEFVTGNSLAISHRECFPIPLTAPLRLIGKT
ncbi:hypothetical protein U9R62_10910 [Cylindrospermopsis raciborskii DSH]|uniref:hypothetical protein n=1 Tax=Cylindrospermopsis raciborskii TaxID=77022 RepID=UPI002EDB94A5